MKYQFQCNLKHFKQTQTHTHSFILPRAPMSGNKNVAHYTDFNTQHFQRKILHAPGGESHFSLAWSNQKTDYGLPKNRSYTRPSYQQPKPVYQNQAYQPYYQQPPPLPTQQQQQQPVSQYQYQSPATQYRKQYPQQPGSYANISKLYQLGQNPPQQGVYQLSSPTPVMSGGGYSQLDQIDIASRKYDERQNLSISSRNQSNLYENKLTLPINSNNNNKYSAEYDNYPATKIQMNQGPSYAPGYYGRANLGSNIYAGGSSSPYSQPQLKPEANYYDRENMDKFKPSVKVHNPPGGKSSLTLG